MASVAKIVAALTEGCKWGGGATGRHQAWIRRRVQLSLRAIKRHVGNEPFALAKELVAGKGGAGGGGKGGEAQGPSATNADVVRLPLETRDELLNGGGDRLHDRLFLPCVDVAEREDHGWLVEESEARRRHELNQRACAVPVGHVIVEAPLMHTLMVAPPLMPGDGEGGGYAGGDGLEAFQAMVLPAWQPQLWVPTAVEAYMPPMPGVMQPVAKEVVAPLVVGGTQPYTPAACTPDMTESKTNRPGQTGVVMPPSNTGEDKYS